MVDSKAQGKTSSSFPFIPPDQMVLPCPILAFRGDKHLKALKYREVMVFLPIPGVKNTILRPWPRLKELIAPFYSFGLLNMTYFLGYGLPSDPFRRTRTRTRSRLRIPISLKKYEGSSNEWPVIPNESSPSIHSKTVITKIIPLQHLRYWRGRILREMSQFKIHRHLTMARMEIELQGVPQSVWHERRVEPIVVPDGNKYVFKGQVSLD
ncbi:hypothetical protein ACH5RR_023017 [Cinchona calisaya]|uniref:Uncharacterized protein n=1 Tax=Cinchona calisaya TaxID=153742 RepID=A0ABD2ZCS0_9GENT